MANLDGSSPTACLDALEPDLVILDEFQRFRDLLNPRTTSGELAQRLFEYEDSHTKVRTLLLSATPYKMYTLSHESDDDHYRDFLQTVRFLARIPMAPWNRSRSRCVSFARSCHWSLRGVRLALMRDSAAVRASHQDSGRIAACDVANGAAWSDRRWRPNAPRLGNDRGPRRE